MSAEATSRRRTPLPIWLSSQEAILGVLLIVVVAILSLLSENFFTSYNLLTQTRFFVEVGLIALPMTMIIITGGIDLSVGSILGFCAVIFGVAWQSWGMGLPLAALLTVMVGMLCGALNGWLIAGLRVPPLIVTLATLAIYRGFALGISQASPVSGFPESFFFWGQGYMGPFPTQFLIFIVAAVVAGIVLSRTVAGRFIYAVGANETAARFAGLPVDRIKLLLYTASGTLAAVAALIFVSRVSTAKADAGLGTELDVITAVVLGGTSIYGGQGSILGTVLGLVLVTLLRNGLALAGVKGDASVVIIGTMLVLAVLINSLLQRRAARV